MSAPWTEQDIIENAWTALHKALETAVRQADHVAREKGYSGAEPEADAKVALADAFLAVAPLRDTLNRAVEALLVRGCSLIGAPTRDLQATRDAIKAREQERAERQRVEDARERER
jgi:hypothetical protein